MEFKGFSYPCSKCEAIFYSMGIPKDPWLCEKCDSELAMEKYYRLLAKRNESMKRKENILICLTEECAEIIQIADKALRFGLDNVRPRRETTNRQELVKELNDLLGVVELAQEEGIELPGLYDRQAIEAKKEKVLKYIEVSKELGMIDEG
jgi:NTP pyrophosphatase (non-canonical NTP hydrolase)